MGLRINGATSGYVELDVPAIAGTSSIILPTGSQTLASESFVNSYTSKVGLMCKVTKSAGQSIANGNITDVTWDTNLYDPLNMHTGTSQYITIPSGYDGTWLFSANLLWANNSTGQRETYMTAAGANVAYVVQGPSSAGGASQNLSSVVKMTAGQTVHLAIYQSSGGALSTSSNPYVWLAATRIGN
jgi:hypothetical protein